MTIATMISIAVAILISARLPAIGIEQVAPGSELVRLTRQGDPAGAYRITIARTQSGDIAVHAITAEDFMDWADSAIAARPLARQDALARIARSGVVHLDLTDGRSTLSIDRRVTRTGFRGVATGWPLIATILLCMLVSCWTLAVKRRSLAALCVAGVGIGIAIAATPIVMAYFGEWIFGGRLTILLIDINSVGAQLFGAAMIGLFARYPAPLMSPHATAVLAAIVGAVTIWVLAIDDMVASVHLLGVAVLIEAVLILMLIGWQWHATARDPRGRAFVRWVGAAVLLSIAGFVGLYHLPIMFGGTALLDTTGIFVVFLPFFLSLAVGVVRFRALEMERWSIAVLGYAALFVGLGLVDVVLVFVLNIVPGRAGLLAVSATLLVWIVVRDKVRARFLRAGPAERQQLLQLAVEAVLVRDSAERAARWRDTLRHLFHPLDIADTEEEVASPRIAGDGLVLLMPALAESPPLALTHAYFGHSLFGAQDLRVAREFASLCSAIDRDRDAYDRGVRAERDRIARDLHDDVGARLLTSLHRDNTRDVRRDVRTALADMRTIIGGLIGERTSLSACLAMLRQETAERLSTASIRLDWSSEIADPDTVLHYATAKNLASALRELVTNAIRHAQASTLTVAISTREGWLDLSVADDGIGMPPLDAARVNGLRNVSDRIAEQQGVLEMTSSGRGTRFDLRLPLTPRSEDGEARLPMLVEE